MVSLTSTSFTASTFFNPTLPWAPLPTAQELAGTFHSVETPAGFIASNSIGKAGFKNRLFFIAATHQEKLNGFAEFAFHISIFLAMGATMPAFSLPAPFLAGSESEEVIPIPEWLKLVFQRVEPLEEKAQKLEKKLRVRLEKKADWEKTLEIFNELNRVYPEIINTIEAAINEAKSTDDLEQFIAYGAKFRRFKLFSDIRQLQVQFLEGLGYEEGVKDLLAELAREFGMMGQYLETAVKYLASDGKELVETGHPVVTFVKDNSVTELYGKSAESGLKLAHIYEKNVDMAKAADSYQKTASTHQLLGDIYAKEGDTAKAVAAYLEADKVMDNSARLGLATENFEVFFRSRLTQLTGYLDKARELHDSANNNKNAIAVLMRQLEILDSDLQALQNTSNEETQHFAMAMTLRPHILKGIATRHEEDGDQASAAKFGEEAGDAYFKQKEFHNKHKNFEKAHEAMQEGFELYKATASLWQEAGEYVNTARVHVKAAQKLGNLAYSADKAGRADFAQRMYNETTGAFDAAVEALKAGGKWDDIQAALEIKNIEIAIEGREPHPLEGFVRYFDMIVQNIERLLEYAEGDEDEARISNLTKILSGLVEHDDWTRATGLRQSISDVMTSIAPPK